MGMNIFGLIGLVIFFSVFVAVVAWVWSRPRQEMDACARIPVDEED
jgi:cbb3-type cytochrome oxidase subunit 3